MLKRSLVAVVLVLTSLTLCAAAQQLQKEDIFSTAPFASSHASTLVELRGGAVLAAWFGGTHEGADDVAIWGARRSPGDGPGKWTAPFLLAREPGVPCWNPVLFHSADGRLWLYYKFGPSVRTWTGARIFSDDEGKTWSAPEHLPAGLLGPIKDKPALLPAGVIVSGTSVESYSSWAPWIERSTDNGRTWRTIGPIAAPAANSGPDGSPGEHVHGLIQPAVVRLHGNHLRFYARSSRDIGHICVADSMDNGLSWSAAHMLDLPNPNSGIDAVGLRGGGVALIFNNSATARTPLNLALSRDGEHFHPLLTLEDAPGEYSYPAIIQAANGDLLATYTWNRKRIRFVRIPLAAVDSGAAREKQ